MYGVTCNKILLCAMQPIAAYIYSIHVAALLSNISNKTIQQTHIIIYFYFHIYQTETYVKKLEHQLNLTYYSQLHTGRFVGHSAHITINYVVNYNVTLPYSNVSKPWQYCNVL